MAKLKGINIREKRCLAIALQKIKQPLAGLLTDEPEERREIAEKRREVTGNDGKVTGNYGEVTGNDGEVTGKYGEVTGN
ncbi:MAG: hypothetical protein GY739_16740, partial [Mesoflavibacter sp.]|nr:hypothetical protein [Mesoflavibacter sp.]